jgi:membrane protease YdiL (CAAX protease family)
MNDSPSSGWKTPPCYPELALVAAAGAAHVVIELVLSAAVARIYNVTVSVAFLGYVVWRLARTPGAARIWGMRLDNLSSALRAHLTFAAVAALGFVGYGLIFDCLHLPLSFWLTVGIYPVWGIAQQFALQNLLARHLIPVLRHPAAVALVAALLFSAAHYPQLQLVALTFVAGFFFTLVYLRHPNLWAVGFAHGILGSLAFYIVLGEDPGAEILRALGVN